MRMNNYAYLAAGIAIGVAVVFYQVDTPRADKCETYKVAAKVATAYVLKPPAQEPTVIYKACPQTTENVDPVNTLEKRVEETPKNEHEPRRRRRHRVRRYWR
jgi:hypothetical protein